MRKSSGQIYAFVHADILMSGYVYEGIEVPVSGDLLAREGVWVNIYHD